MQKQKGFTIIELIVVIAIIAVLATIVMINVTSYIAKGKDASIQGNLANLMTNSASYFDSTSNYTNFCAATTGAASYLTAIDSTEGGTGKTDCNVATSAWAACAQLVNTDAYFCVDSTGAKKSIATRTTCVAAWAATVCP